MKANNQRVFEVKEQPLRQCQRLLKWFAHIDVNSFDIHVRRYSNENATNGDSTKEDTTDKEKKGESWITCHERIDSERVIELWKWLRYENSNNADIYFRPHGLGEHPVIFLDDLNVESAHKVARAYSAAVIKTSNNNTQVWVKTASPLSLSQRKQVQSKLSSLGYTDTGSTSGDHLGRLCGMFSHKRKEWVNVIYFSTPQAYNASPIEQISPQRGGGACVLKNSPINNLPVKLILAGRLGCTSLEHPTKWFDLLFMKVPN